MLSAPAPSTQRSPLQHFPRPCAFTLVGSDPQSSFHPPPFKRSRPWLPLPPPPTFCNPVVGRHSISSPALRQHSDRKFNRIEVRGATKREGSSSTRLETPSPDESTTKATERQQDSSARKENQRTVCGESAKPKDPRAPNLLRNRRTTKPKQPPHSVAEPQLG